MPRIHLYADSELPESGPFLLSAGASHHLLKVLRARHGQELTLFNGDGWMYQASLTGSSGAQAQLAIRGRHPRSTGSPLAIQVFLPLTRGERWDWSLQKAVELGVRRIQPVACRHGVVQLSEARGEKRLARWRDIVIAACEQSGSTTIPELAPPVALETAWAGVRGAAFVLDPEGGQRFTDLGHPGPEITLLSGPEGGLAAEEVAAAQAHGFRSLRMGPRILRAETAAIAAIAVAQALWGDL
ncbi:16S rRNA (uracil(1498)-N(3))-methyltransferase [Acidithiobacillus ferrooxidans]|jgi:16S rRNA (uracil1498-N3)-methyltransferase|uniref:16S rRNA (uracil(1498)-N(3))-methyltransferase n=1 Tax=Acidithiobacillus ferrooxidans TaxID=920 RepID=UPI0013D0471E|nr:16S rRNA (uracil(1498)-N(3))-methyltransferase [Acidithiobacillus ferrooxidans]MBU2857578.1 16S rRNA (uracil(1498)-N(3))-methyltransferase [Acidithiobacillus ferrooxidans]MBU2859015.1 16S rRNA (uracil(1498)-N(3))-methyltransferase [Acidithiobacillus ferrooxidans]MCR2830234.1 16S rRNA (uracil(1498)-N(3))-methyltransferase [Acidithiobacillus ferrooxidans]